MRDAHENHSDGRSTAVTTGTRHEALEENPAQARTISPKEPEAPLVQTDGEDAIVMSESGAKKMASEHVKEKTVDIREGDKVGPRAYNAFLGTSKGQISPQNMAKLGPGGVVKEGAVVTTGDVLIPVVSVEALKNDPEVTQQLRRVFKDLGLHHRDRSVTWDEPYDGTVVKVVHTPTVIRVYVKTEEPFKVGDKVSAGFDEETEVLSEHGWKSFSDLEPGEAVCTLDPETDEILYEAPSEVVSYPAHPKQMYRLETQALDIQVTEDHPLFVEPRSAKDVGYGLHPASEVAGKRVRHKCDGAWTGLEDETFTIPGIEPAKSGKGHYVRASFQPKEVAIKDLFYFMGIYLAEGSCTLYEKKGGYEVFIAQSLKAKPDTYEKIEALVRRMGFNPHRDPSGVKVWSQQLFEFVREHLAPDVRGKACYYKRIPRWAFDYDTPALEALYEGLMDGDGHRGKTTRTYHSTSKGLCDDVQELVQKIGMAANVRLWQPAREETIMGRPVPAQCRERWATQIRIKRLRPTVNHGHTKRQNGQAETWIEHDGPVHHVVVPGRTVYVRRNGKAYWTGGGPSRPKRMAA